MFRNREPLSDSPLEERIWEWNTINPKLVNEHRPPNTIGDQHRHQKILSEMKNKFSDEQFNFLENSDRQIGSSTLIRAQNVLGTNDGLYNVTFDHVPFTQIPDIINGKTPTPEPKPYTISVEHDNVMPGIHSKMMNLSVLMPMTRSEVKYLTNLSEKAMDRSSTSLYKRIHKAVKSEGDSRRNLRQLLDREDYQTLNEIALAREIAVVDAVQTGEYFMHMASLNLNGEFAPTKNAEYLTQMLGMYEEGVRPVHYHARSKNEITNPLNVDDSQLRNLKKQLQNDWYTHEAVGQLNWNLMLRDFSQFGNARINRQENSTSSHEAAMAAESITSQLYQRLGGEDVDGTFSDKLDYVADHLNLREEVDMHKQVYHNKDEDTITVNHPRNSRIHKGQIEFQSLNGLVDEWSTQFYTDVTKTLLSGLTDKPQGFFDYDDFARDTALYSSNPKAALIPAQDKLAYKKPSRLP